VSPKISEKAGVYIPGFKNGCESSILQTRGYRLVKNLNCAFQISHSNRTADHYDSSFNAGSILQVFLLYRSSDYLLF